MASLTEAQGARLAGPAQAGPLTVAGLGDYDANGQPDLHVTIAGDAGALRADVSSKALSDGSVVDHPDVELAELDLSAVDAGADAAR